MTRHDFRPGFTWRSDASAAHSAGLLRGCIFVMSLASCVAAAVLAPPRPAVPVAARTAPAALTLLDTHS